MLVHEGHLFVIMACGGGGGGVLNQRGALDRIFIQENIVINKLKLHILSVKIYAQIVLFPTKSKSVSKKQDKAGNGVMKNDDNERLQTFVQNTRN